MTKVEIVRRADPLGYEGPVLDRLRVMARDELAGVGDAAVQEEAAVLRARLKGQADTGSAAKGTNT
jgi:hypothetical protein